MRRFILVLVVAALWVAMLVVMAMPALGDPPEYTFTATEVATGGRFTVQGLHPADCRALKQEYRKDPQWIDETCTREPRGE
jgi:hypothetical protein